MKVTMPPGLLRDLVGTAGAGLMAYGAGLHYLPLGFVAGGACLFQLAIAGTLRAGGAPPRGTPQAAEPASAQFPSLDRR